MAWMRSSPTSLIPLILIVCLSVSAIWATMRGIADIYGFSAARMIVRWEKLIETPVTQEWQRTLDTLNNAASLDSRRPSIAEDLGQLYFWQHTDKPLWDIEAKKANREALKHFAEAIRRRPSWPYTWANLATAKFRLTELDALFFHSLERAAELGPWEPAVQRVVADLGLAAWKILPDSTRTLVNANVRRGLRRQAPTMIRIALRHRQRTLIYSLVENDEDLLKLFQREEKRSSTPAALRAK